MPLVTESAPTLKCDDLRPLQVMVAVIATPFLLGCAESLSNQLREGTNGLMDLVWRFRAHPPTPERTCEFEGSLAEQLRQLGLTIMEFAVNNLEPEFAGERPSRVRCDGAEYSAKGDQTPHRGGVACRFGMLTLNRWSYEPLREEREAGLKSIAPLEFQLGLVAGKATPALAEVIGRLSQERSENAVREILLREHGVTLGAESVTRIRDAVATGIAKHLEDLQVGLVLNAIRRGRSQGRVILAAGRDGIFVPMGGTQDDRWKEAAVGTVTVYVKPPRGELRRLATVYLGQMPKPGQEELSDNLTSLLQRVLSDDCARNIQLVYLTDAGHHPQEYYRNVLQDMDDPHCTGQKLKWTWCVDFFHASSRLNVLADALFRDATQASEWVRRMRHLLKHASNAVNRILHSAAYHRAAALLRGKARENFDKAYQYLWNYRRHMDYATYRSRGMPIGSGVTEAACKTVFTQRFKCSGMIWNRDDDHDHRDPRTKLTGARSVLTLRLAVLSRVWPDAFQAYLATQTISSKAITSWQLAT